MILDVFGCVFKCAFHYIVHYIAQVYFIVYFSVFRDAFDCEFDSVFEWVFPCVYLSLHVHACLPCPLPAQLPHLCPVSALNPNPPCISYIHPLSQEALVCGGGCRGQKAIHIPRLISGHPGVTERNGFRASGDREQEKQLSPSACSDNGKGGNGSGWPPRAQRAPFTHTRPSLRA